MHLPLLPSGQAVSSYATAAVVPLSCRFGREAPGCPVPSVLLLLSCAMLARSVAPFGAAACVYQMLVPPVTMRAHAAVASALAFARLQAGGILLPCHRERVAGGVARDHFVDGIALAVGELLDVPCRERRVGGRRHPDAVVRPVERAVAVEVAGTLRGLM